MNHASRLMMAASVAAALMATSCRSSKSAEEVPVTNATTTITVASMKEQLAAVMAGNNDWTSVKMPVTVSFTSPIKQRLSGTLTMTRDQGVSVSIRMLGMEVGQAVIVNDSIYARVKYPSKLMLAEPVSSLTAGVPMTVGNIQDLLLGHIFVPGDNSQPTDKDFTLASDPSVSGGWTAKSKAKLPKDCFLTFLLQGASLTSVMAGMTSSGQVTATYGDLQSTTNAGTCAGTVNVASSGLDNSVNALLSLSISKAEWDKNGTTVEWKPTSGYRRVTAAQVIEMLK